MLGHAPNILHVGPRFEQLLPSDVFCPRSRIGQIRVRAQCDVHVPGNTLNMANVHFRASSVMPLDHQVILMWRSGGLRRRSGCR
jgi:hypothetical protein